MSTTRYLLAGLTVTSNLALKAVGQYNNYDDHNNDYHDDLDGGYGRSYELTEEQTAVLIAIVGITVATGCVAGTAYLCYQGIKAIWNKCKGDEEQPLLNSGYPPAVSPEYSGTPSAPPMDKVALTTNNSATAANAADCCLSTLSVFATAAATSSHHHHEHDHHAPVHHGHHHHDTHHGHHGHGHRAHR